MIEGHKCFFMMSHCRNTIFIHFIYKKEIEYCFCPDDHFNCLSEHYTFPGRGKSFSQNDIRFSKYIPFTNFKVSFMSKYLGFVFVYGSHITLSKIGDGSGVGLLNYRKKSYIIG